MRANEVHDNGVLFVERVIQIQISWNGKQEVPFLKSSFQWNTSCACVSFGVTERKVDSHTCKVVLHFFQSLGTRFQINRQGISQYKTPVKSLGSGKFQYETGFKYGTPPPPFLGRLCHYHADSYVQDLSPNSDQSLLSPNITVSAHRL